MREPGRIIAYSMRLLGRLFLQISLRSDLRMYDVIIIGAGVSGAATARELSRYKIKACVIKKKRMYVAALPRQIVLLSMPAMMLLKDH